MYIQFNNTYARLPERFYCKVSPTPVRNPNLGLFNFALAKELGFDFKDLDTQKIAEIFSGNTLLPGSEPIALIYAGHQFGHFVPQLGDGRAILLGECMDTHGEQRDIQLKGSGKTPYSRNGDGRAALGPMIREYIVSEAMHALGIKTTRALALVTTGESVYRDTLLPGAILTRIAASHVRVGSFEYFAAQKDISALKILTDYVIQRHYPTAKAAPNPYQLLLAHIRDAQASLMVDWMRVGFIHGVMNTDNMALSGETIDYGPCAFIDAYDSHQVFSAIDRHGRYAFSNQANICFWNLMQFGKSIACLLDPCPIKALRILNETVDAFKAIYESKCLTTLGEKIGISHPNQDDRTLIEELFAIMQKESLDYTLTFRYLSYLPQNIPWPFGDLFTPSPALNGWIKKWGSRLPTQMISAHEISDRMFTVNPAFIPRNHKIEEVIQYTMEREDFSKIHAFLQILAKPYSGEHKDHLEYMRTPTAKERVRQTFCGT